MESSEATTRLIKKCPKCGRDSYLKAEYSEKYARFSVYCKCAHCSAIGREYVTYEDPARTGWSNRACQEAIAAWNAGKATTIRGVWRMADIDYCD